MIQFCTRVVDASCFGSTPPLLDLLLGTLSIFYKGVLCVNRKSHLDYKIKILTVDERLKPISGINRLDDSSGS